MTAKKKETNDGQERFSLFVDAVQDYAMFLLDPCGYVLTWNSGAERIKGYKADEIIGKHFSIFYPPELLARNHPQYELDIAAREGRYEEEGQRLRQDGTLFWAAVTITALKNSDGTVSGYAKITRDITDRKKSEQQLRESEERMRLLVEAVKDYAIFMVDLDGRIMSWNSGAARMNGYTADEVIGQPLSIFYTPESIAASYPECELKAARENGHFEEVGIRKRKDGSTYWANVILTSLYDDAGNLQGFAKVTRDITERIQAEQALKNAHSELEQRVEQRTAELQAAVDSLQREIQERKQVEKELLKAKEAALASSVAKSAFLANMSHEIRTPLGAVLGFSELLLQPDLTEEERNLYLDTLKRNSNLLLTIINDILDLSKVESGTFQIHRSTVELNEFLSEAVAVLGMQADEKALDFSVEAEGSVPRTIETDPVRLKQILFNIVGNAIKFTDKGGVKVTVKTVSQLRGGPQLAIDVTDTGPGITHENAQRLFEPFMQVDSSLTRQFGGTGLGLALSRRLAQALGGNVILTESTPGKGSTFTITIECGQLPKRTLLFQNSRSDSGSSDCDKPELHLVPNLKRTKVLLVEDLPDNRVLICSILRKLGAEVDWAENGCEGLQKALKGDYDVILMDLQMPVMDGYEATLELRKRGYGKPIVAVTAHAMNDDKERVMQSGFPAHLTKPIDQHALWSSLVNLRGTVSAESTVH
ncbi:PAS domain-containing hybrid sensor histidine kinase/response regulator [Oligoflexus tunisiensis]|uniref:PAS domain-containing hybrid sensor histidine kinase/response regulator n=1 Tax=Oligoflexus tunisiensis TaxID=708132 RepID=UPI000A4235F4|nr:PAS domain-containing hybrid sensor histidine kinase/response regulator [Oligoflexus tunisiensis]